MLKVKAFSFLQFLSYFRKKVFFMEGYQQIYPCHVDMSVGVQL